MATRRRADATHLIVQHIYNLNDRYPISIFESVPQSTVRIFTNAQSSMYTFANIILRDAVHSIVFDQNNNIRNVSNAEHTEMTNDPNADRLRRNRARQRVQQVLHEFGELLYGSRSTSEATVSSSMDPLQDYAQPGPSREVGSSPVGTSPVGTSPDTSPPPSNPSDVDTIILENNNEADPNDDDEVEVSSEATTDDDDYKHDYSVSDVDEGGEASNEDDTEEWPVCKICSFKRAFLIFLFPCGHTVCPKCFKKISRCPFCRKRIRRARKCYT